MENEIETQDGAPENTEGTEEVQDIDWAAKAKENEAEAAKWKRIAERNAKKAEKSNDDPKLSAKSESSDLDWGQRAFLKASGLNGADEIQLAKEYANRTGEPLDVVIEDDIFKARLDRLRTTKANELATDTKAKRGTNGNGRDSADYWINKLGPTDPVPSDLPRELREKIVDARRQRGSNAKMFYNE